MSHAALVALALRVFAALGLHPSLEVSNVADAIATAAETDPHPFADPELVAGLEADYAARESHASTHPIAFSWDARAHVSCGVWQMACAFVEKHTVLEQAETWRDRLHRDGLDSIDSSPARASFRLREVNKLLGRIP